MWYCSVHHKQVQASLTFHSVLQLSRYQKQSGKCILVADEALSFRVNFPLLILLQGVARENFLRRF